MDNELTVLDYGQYLISKSNEKGFEMNVLKLQKILFFLQASYFVAFGEPLFLEPFVEWDFGYVCPVAYNHFYHQNAFMPQRTEKFYYKNHTKVFYKEISDPNIQKIISFIIDFCGDVPDRVLLEVLRDESLTDLIIDVLAENIKLLTGDCVGKNN